MFCAQCGSSVPEGASRCPSCGAAVGGPLAAPAGQGLWAQLGRWEGRAAPDAGGYGHGPSDGYGGAYGAGGGYGYAPAPGTPPPVGARRPNGKRSTALIILLGIVTLGVYDYIALHEIAEDMNVVCEGDREDTPGMLPFIILSWLTGGIYASWWYYRLANRLQRNAPRYGLSFKESGTTVLVWEYAGCCLCCVGPIIAMNIIVKNSNALSEAYNARLDAAA